MDIKMTYNLMNGRLRYFSILNKRIENNNLKLDITVVWEKYYKSTPPYIDKDKTIIELINKERKVFNKCVEHLDDIILKKYR